MRRCDAQGSTATFVIWSVNGIEGHLYIHYAAAVGCPKPLLTTWDITWRDRQCCVVQHCVSQKSRTINEALLVEGRIEHSWK